MIICRFSIGLDEMTRKQQSDAVHVARFLHAKGRFSCFEASENATIAETMTYLCNNGWFKTFDADYPWTRVEITQAGLNAIGLAAAQEDGE